MRIGTFFIALTYTMCMLAMISDYKVLCNIVGSITTIVTLLYLLLNKARGVQPLEKRTKLFAILFLSYFTITSLFQFDVQQWGINFMVYLMVITPFFLNTHLELNRELKLTKTFVYSFFVIWNVFLVLCFVSCLLIPNLARMMAAERGSFYSVINGGGYYMGNGSAILIAYLFNSLLKGEIKGKLLKLLSVLEILLMIATILVINSFVIFVSMIVGLTFVTINGCFKSRNYKILSYLLFSIVGVVIYVNLSSILGYIINNTNNEFWNKRFEETYEAVVNDDNSAHVDSREAVYQISIEGIISSPIFGNGYKTGNAFDTEGRGGVGNHSSILDSLAQFGVIGSLPLFLFLFYPLLRARDRKERWEHLIPFFIMAFLNPVFKCFHVMVILFLIIPSIERIKDIKIRKKSFASKKRRIILSTKQVLE